MNQKDYKEIARIFEAKIILRRDDLINTHLKELVYNLADCFENQDKLWLDKNKHCDVEDIKEWKRLYGFNRKQFLKDCGVK